LDRWNSCDRYFAFSSRVIALRSSSVCTGVRSCNPKGELFITVGRVGGGKRGSDMELHFFRDASNRLTHDRAEIDAISYPATCKMITEHFRLNPTSELVVGADQIFGNHTDGTATIELAWDNWLCFTVTAQDSNAEPLIRNIAAFLAETIPLKRIS
jgi:hypothetical protein